VQASAVQLNGFTGRIPNFFLLCTLRLKFKMEQRDTHPWGERQKNVHPQIGAVTSSGRTVSASLPPNRLEPKLEFEVALCPLSSGIAWPLIR
jgi:hypothetical protein